MPRAAPRGGPHPLSPPLRFQVLRVSFEISVDDPATRRELRFLSQSAIQPEGPRSTVSYQVHRRDGAYEIARNGELEDVQFEPSGVLGVLYSAVQRDALAAWPGAPVLQALTGRRNGERFAVVGEPLRDRSRLALALLGHGVDIEGDDLAILHDGVLTAYPRPLRVCGVDVPLPPRAGPRETLPFVGSNIETGSWALDIASAGIDWRITTGGLDTVILLETNYGGQSRLAQIPRYEMVRALMSCCDPRANVPQAIRTVARLTDGARHCYRLWLGSLDHLGAVWPGLA
ncbi:MAG TPA: hypothetical protein VIJ20_02810 [Solirubrobacteraceae bacterium]